MSGVWWSDQPCRWRPWCPVCGVFARKAVRRARRADDAALVAFHARLARDTRRARAVAMMGDVAPPWQRQLIENLADLSWRGYSGRLDARETYVPPMLGYGLRTVRMGQTTADGNVALRVTPTAETGRVAQLWHDIGKHLSRGDQ